jgi:3-keto-disaccharide hydrolase
MKAPLLRPFLAALGGLLVISVPLTIAVSDEPSGDDRPRAGIDGTGPGWRALGEGDFAPVNCNPETWTWKDGVIHCTGRPIGVIRTKTPVTNFELVAQWRHLQSGGNSGIFVWVPEAVLKGIEPGRLPRGGIEVQILDHGYAELHEKKTGKKGDFFTTHGDVFPVGTSKMKPFPPTSPNGSRSFPTKRLSKGVGQWNHYYVRGINGEIRLWVNGEEVSGGNGCSPASGYLCLESEGAPVEFRDLRIRELP